MRARVSLVERAHEAVAAALGEGDLAIDATVGNGHDTLLLARLVGATGRVFGFDVQSAALAAAGRHLQEAGVLEGVTLIEAGHEELAARLPAASRGHARAIMFNLGYLPGSDKSCITRPATTLHALQQAQAWLAPGGVLTVLAYTGHAGGRDEAARVREWLQGLDPLQFSIEQHQHEPGQRPGPELTVVRRCVGVRDAQTHGHG